MAKALFGHVSALDVRTVAEMQRLQRRVRDLETQLLRLQAENDALAVATRGESLLTTFDMPKPEPVLA